MPPLELEELFRLLERNTGLYSGTQPNQQDFNNFCRLLPDLASLGELTKKRPDRATKLIDAICEAHPCFFEYLVPNIGAFKPIVANYPALANGLMDKILDSRNKFIELFRPRPDLDLDPVFTYEKFLSQSALKLFPQHQGVFAQPDFDHAMHVVTDGIVARCSKKIAKDVKVLCNNWAGFFQRPMPEREKIVAEIALFADGQKSEIGDFFGPAQNQSAKEFAEECVRNYRAS